ncbi:hypothetical protein PMZ80_004302 [Knufia obscura]|nr:hypothetical protein PMZ80_004302 [Knufia obscura]
MELEQGSMTKSQFLSRVMEKPAEQVGDGTPFRRAFRKARSDLQVSARRGTVSARKYTPGPAQRQGLRRNHIKDNDRIWGKVIERPSYDSINFFVDQGAGDAYTLARTEAWELAKLELEMIMECGWAQCASQSLERNLQTIGITRKHYGVLYTSKRKTSMQVRAWMGKVEQGRSYYFEAAGLDEQLLGP